MNHEDDAKTIAATVADMRATSSDPLVLAVADMLDGVGQRARSLNFAASPWTCTAGEMVVTLRQSPHVTAALAVCNTWPVRE